MQHTAKSQTLSEMMNDIFSSYFPIVKNIYFLMLIQFVLSLTTISSSNGINRVAAMSSLIIYIACMLKANALLEKDSKMLASKELFFYLSKRIFPYIFMCILLSLCLVICLALITILLYSLLSFIPESYLPYEGDYDLILDCILLIGIISTMYFFFSTHFFWIEKMGIFQSIKENYKLIKKQFLFATKSLICFGMVFSFPYFCIIFIALPLGMYPDLDTNSFSLSYLSRFTFSILEIIYFPLWVAAPLYLYKNLKSRCQNKRLPTKSNDRGSVGEAINFTPGD